MTTYSDVIKILQTSPPENKLYVPVWYVKETMEWLPVDRKEYLRQLLMISEPYTHDYPCYFQVESDGEMFIHPKVQNQMIS